MRTSICPGLARHLHRVGRQILSLARKHCGSNPSRRRGSWASRRRAGRSDSRTPSRSVSTAAVEAGSSATVKTSVVTFHADAARRAVRHRALRQRRPGRHARAAGQEQHPLGSRRQRDVLDPIEQLIRPHVGFEVRLAGRVLRLVPLERLELLLHLLGFQRQRHPPPCFIELGGRLVRRIEEQAPRLRPLAVVGQIVVDFRLDLILPGPTAPCGGTGCTRHGPGWCPPDATRTPSWA